MTDQTKTIASTLVIVACLLLLGALAYMRIEGAAVAAIAVVTTLVAWLTRAPDKVDPPPGAKLVPLVGVGAIIASLFACGGAPSAPYQRAAEAAYGAALLRCVDEAATLAESKACRERVNAEWQISETVAKDGGK